MYNADIFGAGLKETLEKLGISNFLSREKMTEADIIVSAIAKPENIKAENIKEGAIIIDISTVKVEGKVKGDADFESLKNKASFITPVPGGIGPMTIAFLLKNVLEIFKRKNNFK